MKIKETISALIDEEFQSEQQAFCELAQTEELLRTWHTYHLIGHVKAFWPGSVV